MKIAILNESFLTDRHLATLRGLGELSIYENTETAEEAVERLKGVDIAIADCFVAPLNKTVFKQAGTLKFLSINSTSFDMVDVVAAKEQGIAVAHVPGFSTESVAEFAFALMLAVNRKVLMADAAMRQAPFQIDPANQEQKKYLGFNLFGKTLGIIGLGNIGQRTAEIGRGFGMNILAYNRSKKDIKGIKQVELKELLQTSDVISFHLPLTNETEGLITAERLALLKPTAILVNTSSGKLIDELALSKALRTHKIAGAGLDLLADWTIKNPLLKMENIVLAPDLGFFTHESLENAADIIVKNVQAFVAGQPINIVNP